MTRTEMYVARIIIATVDASLIFALLGLSFFIIRTDDNLRNKALVWLSDGNTAILNADMHSGQYIGIHGHGILSHDTFWTNNGDWHIRNVYKDHSSRDGSYLPDINDDAYQDLSNGIEL